MCHNVSREEWIWMDSTHVCMYSYNQGFHIHKGDPNNWTTRQLLSFVLMTVACMYNLYNWEHGCNTLKTAPKHNHRGSFNRGKLSRFPKSPHVCSETLERNCTVPDGNISYCFCWVTIFSWLGGEDYSWKTVTVHIQLIAAYDSIYGTHSIYINSPILNTPLLSHPKIATD